MIRLTEGAGGWQVETPRGTIKAGDVIIATNGYTDGIWPKLQKTIVPVFSGVVANAVARPRPSTAFSLKPAATTFCAVAANAALVTRLKDPSVGLTLRTIERIEQFISGGSIK